MDGIRRAKGGTREAETERVVALGRLVPVAVRRAAVVRIVVPGAATDNPVGARFPSAADHARTQRTTAQAPRIRVADMGKQAGTAMTKLAWIDLSRLAGLFDEP